VAPAKTSTSRSCWYSKTPALVLLLVLVFASHVPAPCASA